MTEISPVMATVPTVINRPSKPITEVSPTGVAGQYKVNQTWYEVVLYDYKGQLKEVTNSYRVSYLI